MDKDKTIKLHFLDAVIKLIDQRVDKKLAQKSGGNNIVVEAKPSSPSPAQPQPQQKKRVRNPPVTPDDFECQGNRITGDPCPKLVAENFQAGHPTKIKDPATNKITTYQTCKACKKGVDAARAKARTSKKPKTSPEEEEEEEQQQQQEEDDE